MLDQQQIDLFNKQGYLILPAVFTPDEVALMQQEADFILSLIINASLFHQRHSRRLDIRRMSGGGMIVRKIQPIVDLSLALAKFSRDDRLIGPLNTLMGDIPVLMEEKLNYKQPVPELPVFTVPEDDDRFGVHNDWAYYKINGYPTDILSSAITIDECHEDNGPLFAYPGTHLDHVEHQQVRNGLEVSDGKFKPDEAIPLLAPPGSVMLFHSLLLHTSGPNRSGKPRRVMIYSHYPKNADMGIDVRNGPTRLREAPWEWEYQRRKLEGSYEDQFKLTDMGK